MTRKEFENYQDGKFDRQDLQKLIMNMFLTTSESKNMTFTKNTEKNPGSQKGMNQVKSTAKNKFSLNSVSIMLKTTDHQSLILCFNLRQVKSYQPISASSQIKILSLTIIYQLIMKAKMSNYTKHLSSHLIQTFSLFI